MNGAGEGIGKILTSFRTEALESVQRRLELSLTDEDLKNPRKHLETCWQLWMLKGYPRALKKLAQWHEWSKLSKAERESRADAYLCGFYRGLYDALFLVYVQDCTYEKSKRKRRR